MESFVIKFYYFEAISISSQPLFEIFSDCGQVKNEWLQIEAIFYRLETRPATAPSELILNHLKHVKTSIKCHKEVRKTLLHLLWSKTCLNNRSHFIKNSLTNKRRNSDLVFT